MGFTQNQDEIRDYCPYCETQTDILIERLDDEISKTCLECENDLLIPTVKAGEPFVFGGKVYTMDTGSDDDLSIARFNEK